MTGPSWMPSVPAVSRRARLFMATLFATAGLGGVGYFAYEHSARSTERRQALALAEKGKPDEALVALRRCLDRDPNDSELLWSLVRLKIRSGAPVTDVEPDLDQLARLTPDDPAVFRAQFDLYRRLDRHAEAFEAARRAVELDPTDDHLRGQLAAVALSCGRFAEAAVEFRRLLAGSHSAPLHELKTGLARAEWEQGHAAEAVRLLDEALAVAPDFPPAQILRGMIHSQQGEDELAVAVLRRVRPTSPAEQEIVLYHLALSLGRLGRADESKKVFAELTALQNALRYLTDARQRPADAGLQLRAAEALLGVNRPNDARAVLEESMSRLGPSRPVLNALAACYDQLGQPDLARVTREKARQLP